MHSVETGKDHYNRVLIILRPLQLFQTNVSVIKAETALMYDAVHLFAKALHDLDTSQQIDIQPLSCDGQDTWPHGYSLINYMKIVSAGKFSP